MKKYLFPVLFNIERFDNFCFPAGFLIDKSGAAARFLPYFNMQRKNTHLVAGAEDFFPVCPAQDLQKYHFVTF